MTLIILVFPFSFQTVKSLRVVNDVAERAVALVQEYNRCTTKDEEQFQCLLQIVQEHRKQYPATKSNKTDLKV